MTTNTLVSGYNPVKLAIADLSGNTADIVGWLFRCKKGSDMVNIQDVRHAMRVVGLDESQAKDVKKENAMRKTMSDMKKGKVINELPSDKDSKVMKFQFDKKIVEELSGELQLRFEKIDSLTFDLSSGVIDCQDDVIKDFAYQRLGVRMVSYDKAQFSNFINTVIETNMSRKIVRVDDGWYFFDVSMEEKLKKVIRMINMSDHNAKVLLIPQMKTADNVSIAVEATKESYSDAVDCVFKRLEGHKIDNDGTLTDKVVKNAIDELAQLERQVEISLIQLEAEGDLLKDAFKRCRDFAKDNKEKTELTKVQKDMLVLAKHAMDNGVASDVIVGLLAKESLTLEDLAE